MVNFSEWAFADPLKIEQAACLWAEADPAENSLMRAPQTKSRIEARLQMLTGAIARGALEVDASTNALRMIGDHRSSLVSRASLILFANSISERPAFLFDTMLAQVAANNPDAPADKSPAPKAVNKGGRPREWDWDAMFIEMFRVANSPDGLPDKQADMVRHLQSWFSKAIDAEPAETEIKARVSKIYNGLGISRKPRSG